MKLHRQLLLVSLVVLSLPWAGCQYIRQVEQVLRDGQLKALEATARALSSHLESQAALIDLPPHPAIYNPTHQIYLHALRSPAIVDGYDVEWRSLDLQGQTYRLPRQPELRLSALGGAHDDNIYLFFSITDPSLDHHNPQSGDMEGGDYLVLRALADDLAIREYFFRSGGTSAVTARYLNDANQLRQEHRIQGEWRETNSGYTLELDLPQSLAPRGLDFYYRDASTQQVVGSYHAIDYPAPWVRPSAALASTLAPYGNERLRISVLNPHHWLLAQSGTLHADSDDNAEEKMVGLDWLYRLAIGQRDFPALEEAHLSGRMQSREVRLALQGERASGWYQQGNQRVARVVLPIRGDGRIAGAVALEESSDSLLAETNLAFRGLLLYTLFATGLVAFGLLAYASWLSWRIRRLNRAAHRAVDTDGKINPELLQSRASDEIGDLTRGYGQLLGRLKDYTDYLRSLSNKLSHELRTPLAVMKSSLDNLDHEQLGPEASTYVQRAREASQRLSNILNAMSSASRMEESIQQAQREQLELDRLLADLINAYRITYPAANFTLQIQPNEAGYRLQASPDLIVQMLDKLVDNALDFCPPDGRIDITLERQKQQLTIAVSNTGPLLPEHMQDQLFDSLVSLRTPTTGKDGKSHLGLGLYIVRLIVDFHEGQVRAVNLPDGSGVSFIISLPVAL